MTDQTLENYEENVDDIDLEVVDDTPEEDRGKPRRPEGSEPNLPDDDEIENYSENVQKRIKQLKYEFHEERRAKEESARLREEALAYAKKASDENQRLKQLVDQGENVLINQAKSRLEVMQEQARREAAEAFDSGETEKFLAANEKVQELKIEMARLKISEEDSSRRAEAAKNQQVLQQRQARQHQQASRQNTQADPVGEEWARRNPWFNKDSEMMGFALGVHDRLVREGVDPRYNAVEYYKRVDEAMQSRFPDKLGVPTHEVEAESRQAGNVVAPANRSAKKPRKVKLTSTQVALAKRLGLKPEQYAAQLLKDA